MQIQSDYEIYLVHFIETECERNYQENWGITNLI